MPWSFEGWVGREEEEEKEREIKSRDCIVGCRIGGARLAVVVGKLRFGRGKTSYPFLFPFPHHRPLRCVLTFRSSAVEGTKYTRTNTSLFCRRGTRGTVSCSSVSVCTKRIYPTRRASIQLPLLFFFFSITILHNHAPNIVRVFKT